MPQSVTAAVGDKRPRKRLFIYGAVTVGVLVLAMAGAGYVAMQRHADPVFRADQAIQKGDLRAAQVELRNALRDKPRDFSLHQRLGMLQMDLADPVAAEKEFRSARSLGADRASIVPQLADALLAQGLNDETLRQVPVTGPTPEATAQFLYRRSVAQLGLADVKAATMTLALVRRVAPDGIVVPLIAARLAAMRDDYAQTEAQVDEVLKQDPKQIDALLMKQQIATARGDHAAALDLAGRAVVSSPWSAMAHIRHATELLYANQDDQAKVDVDAVLGVQPRFIEAVYLRGILLARQGRYQDAEVQLGKLDTVVGRFPQALYYKALIASNSGQAETAAAYARRYNTLVPADPDGIRLVARSDIAVRASDHAIPILERAIADGLENAEVYDLLGSAYGNLGNTPAAIATFQRALALSPKDPTLLTHLGLAQLQAGNIAEATGTLTLTAEIAPSQPAAVEALVSAAIGEGDLARAEQALAQLRERTGDTQQVGILSGLIQVRRQKLDAARDIFAETMRRFPGSVSAKIDYARVLVEQGHRLDGMAIMAEVLAKDAGNVPALNSYMPLLVQDRQLDRVVAVLSAAHTADPHQAGFTATLADALVVSGNAKQAVDVLQAVRAAGPLPPLLLAALARAQAVGGFPDDAKANFRDVLRMMPDDSVDRAALIDVLLRNHEYEPARIELEAGLARAPRNNRFLSTLIELEAQMHGLDAGLKLAADFRADPSHLPFSTLLKGDALMRARRYNAALHAYLDEFTADPSVPSLLRAAGAYVASGQEGDATRLLKQWLKQQPNTPAVLETLAKLDIRANRLEEAQAHLEALLAMVPNSLTALNNLAWTYQQRGDGRARATAQKAYLQGADADSADTLGWILTQGNEAAAGLPLLQQAGSQLPNNPAVQYHLATALSANGQSTEAAPILRAVLAQSDVFPERLAAEKLLTSLTPTVH